MQVGSLDFARSLARLFRLRGEQPQLELAQDLIPVVNAFTLDEPPFHFKRGLLHGSFAPPVAARFSSLAIGALAGTVAVVRYFRAINQNAGDAAVTFEFSDRAQLAADLAPLGGADWDHGGAMDSHRGGSAEVLGGTRVAAGGLAVIAESCPIKGGVFGAFSLPGPIVLRAGDYLCCSVTTAAFGAYMEVYADVYEA